LIGGYRYGGDRFFVPRIFGYLFRLQVSFVQEFINPLMDRRYVGSKDEGIGFKHGHNGHTHHGFSRTAGQDYHAKACPRPAITHHGAGRLYLVIPGRKGFAAPGDGPEAQFQGFSNSKGGKILDRPAQLDEFPLYSSPVYQFKPKDRSIRNQVFGQTLCGGHLCPDWLRFADKQQR